MATQTISQIQQYQSIAPDAREIAPLSGNWADEETMKRVMEIRNKAIADGVSVFRRDVGEGRFLTVIPGSFSVLTLNHSLGQGKHKQAEMAVKIDNEGNASLAALKTPLAGSEGTFRDEYRLHMRVDNLPGVARAGDFYLEPSGSNRGKIALFALGAVFAGAALAAFLHAFPVTFPFAFLIAILCIAASTGCIAGTSAAFELLLRIIQPLYQDTFADFILKHRNEANFEERFLGILIQALEGLDRIHQRGLVHRDVHHNNLLADGEGSLRWNDFGCAAEISQETERGTWLDLKCFGAMVQNSMNNLNGYVSQEFLNSLLSVTNEFGNSIETGGAAIKALQEVRISTPVHNRTRTAVLPDRKLHPLQTLRRCRTA